MRLPLPLIVYAFVASKVRTPASTLSARLIVAFADESSNKTLSPVTNQSVSEPLRKLAVFAKSQMSLSEPFHTILWAARSVSTTSTISLSRRSSLDENVLGTPSMRTSARSPLSSRVVAMTYSPACHSPSRLNTKTGVSYLGPYFQSCLPMVSFFAMRRSQLPSAMTSKSRRAPNSIVTSSAVRVETLSVPNKESGLSSPVKSIRCSVVAPIISSAP